MKTFIYFIVGVLILFGILQLFHKNPRTEDKKQSAQQITKPEKPAPTIEERRKLLIDQYFTKLYADFRTLSLSSKDEYYSDIPALLSKADLFNDISQRISEAIVFEDDSLTNTALRLKKKLITAQSRDFPIIRKEYIKKAKLTLWEDNIKVTGQNRSITFTGGIFASNKNKKQFYENLNHVFEKLRFNYVIFRWHDYDNDGIRYSVGSKKDSDL